MNTVPSVHEYSAQWTWIQCPMDMNTVHIKTPWTNSRIYNNYTVQWLPQCTVFTANDPDGKKLRFSFSKLNRTVSREIFDLNCLLKTLFLWPLMVSLNSFEKNFFVAKIFDCKVRNSCVRVGVALGNPILSNVKFISIGNAAYPSALFHPIVLSKSVRVRQYILSLFT